MTTHSENNKILLGVTGSIAAYKAAELARRFVKRGFEVRTVFSEGAGEFITPLTFEAITGQTTFHRWDQEHLQGIGHIEYADWGDLVVVAPASADFIAKYAAGMGDNPLLATLLATRAQVLLAPAMNVNMLNHPATQANIQRLRERGVALVGPEEGDLACGWVGQGRMAEPWDVFFHALRALGDGSLAGKNVLVVTGPTREPVDPVRFLSNRSSGKMGVALAREAFRRGAHVEVISGPVRAKLPSGVSLVSVNTAREMRDAVMERVFPEKGSSGTGGAGPDIVVMAAAVSDVRPKVQSTEKVRKGDLPVALELEPNPDILAELGALRESRNGVFTLVGFAVETGEVDELVSSVQKKLVSKKADMIIGNLAEDAFESDTNRVWIVDRFGREAEVATTFKNRVAEKIFHHVSKL